MRRLFDLIVVGFVRTILTKDKKTIIFLLEWQNINNKIIKFLMGYCEFMSKGKILCGYQGIGTDQMATDRTN